MELLTATAGIDDLDSFLDELDRIGEEFDCVVQAFDARYVVDPAQLERAVALADRAIERDEAIARERSVEVLLYAAGRRQINRAFEIGVTEGEQSVVVLVDGGNEEDERGAIEALSEVVEPGDWEPGERADEGRIAEFYGITEAERAATDARLAELVCERVALLVVER